MRVIPPMLIVSATLFGCAPDQHLSASAPPERDTLRSVSFAEAANIMRDVCGRTAGSIKTAQSRLQGLGPMQEHEGTVFNTVSDFSFRFGGGTACSMIFGTTESAQEASKSFAFLGSREKSLDQGKYAAFVGSDGTVVMLTPVGTDRTTGRTYLNLSAIPENQN